MAHIDYHVNNLSKDIKKTVLSRVLVSLMILLTVLPLVIVGDYGIFCIVLFIVGVSGHEILHVVKNKYQLDASIYIVTYFALFLPFIIIPLYNVLNGMPKSMIQASQDLGYNKIFTFIKVIIPYGLKAICSGIVIVFLLVIMSVAVSNKLLDNSAGNQMIGNVVNDLSNPSNPFDMQKASSVVLISLLGSSVVYFAINSIPIIYRKIKGGINE